MATDDGFTPVVDDEGWEIVVGAKKQGNYTYKVTYNPQGTTPIIREQGGTFVTDIPVASVTVEAPDEETAKKMAIASGAKGKLSVEKVIPTSTYLQLPTTDKATQLESTGIVDNGNMFDPTEVATMAPYSTAYNLALESVNEQPTFLGSAQAGLKDLLSAPVRGVVGGTPYIGTGDVGKTSEQYASEGFGTNLIPAMLTDYANIPMMAGGGLMQLNKLSGPVKGLFESPAITSVMEQTSKNIPSFLQGTAATATNVARHVTPSAVVGGAYGAVGAGTRQLLDEDRTAADAIAETLGAAIVSGAIGGTGSKLRDSVYNAIQSRMGGISSGRLNSMTDYVMGKIGATKEGTRTNLEKGQLETVKQMEGPLAPIQHAERNPEEMFFWDSRNNASIKKQIEKLLNLERMYKQGESPTITLENYTAKKKIAEDVINSIDDLEKRFKGHEVDTEMVPLRNIIYEITQLGNRFPELSDQLMRYVKTTFGQQAENINKVGTVLFEGKSIPEQVRLASKGRTGTSGTDIVTTKEEVSPYVSPIQGPLSASQKRSYDLWREAQLRAPQIKQMNEGFNQWTGAMNYLNQPVSAPRPITIDPTSWLSRLGYFGDIEGKNLVSNASSLGAKLSPTASGQYPQLMGLDTLKSSK